MSLKTWIAEFYPVEAKDVPPEKAVEASLLMWRGASQANLERHGMRKMAGEYVLCEEDDECAWFGFRVGTCSLCVHYGAPCEHESPHCPLAAASFAAGGAHPCFSDNGAYERWSDTGDPEPMIRLLQAALKGAKP